MKKLICAFAVCLAFCAGLFALESPDRPIRVEADLGFGLTNAELEARGAYLFRINDTFRWDVGAGVSYVDHAFFPNAYGASTNVIGFGSFWFGDWYVTYGTGVGINELGGAAFIPADLRIGWEPGSRENNRCAFKMEFAAMGTTGYTGKDVEEVSLDYGETELKLKDDASVRFLIAPTFNLGIAFRF